MIWNKNTIIYSICGLCQAQAFVVIISTTYLNLEVTLVSGIAIQCNDILSPWQVQFLKVQQLLWRSV